MARLIIGRKARGEDEKILDVNASMQGTMVFKDPVNLKINGKFEGNLNTRGTLTIGETAVVNANIEGDDITIAGAVNGNVRARTRLKIIAPARVTGDIQTPLLSISEGAVLEGKCHMEKSSSAHSFTVSKTLTVEEVAEYLKVNPSVINDWISQGKIPAKKEQDIWKFEKAVIDEWALKEKVK